MRHQRWLLAAMALGVAWGAAAVAFDVPVLALDLLLHLGPTLAGVAAFVTLIGWRPAGPATFTVEDDAFVAPVNARRTVEIAALILVVTSQAALAIEGGGLVDTLLPAVLALVAAVPLARSLRVPGQVELRPSGLRVPGRWRAVDVPWEALRPGTPWAPRLRTQRLDLVVATGYLVLPPSERRAVLGVPIDVLDVHPWFLADAVRYYVAHPEHRAAIGRRAELERLTLRLRDGGAPPALPPGPAVVRQPRPSPRQSPAGHRR